LFGAHGDSSTAVGSIPIIPLLQLEWTGSEGYLPAWTVKASVRGIGLVRPIVIAIIEAVISRSRIVVVPRRWLIPVSVIVKVPTGTMIGTVFIAALETILVGTIVRSRQLVVKLIVMAIAGVFIIVGQRGHDLCTHN
jgi:hypothetical protein